MDVIVGDRIAWAAAQKGGVGLLILGFKTRLRAGSDILRVVGCRYHDKI